MQPLARVHRDAARRGHIDARESAVPRGLHPRTLQRHLRRIGWGPWMPGLWVPGEDEPSSLIRCRIVLAAFGPEALLTGASALWALGIIRAGDRRPCLEFAMGATKCGCRAARDTARDRMLSRDCGWTIDRFWWFELENDPRRFIREVISRLQRLNSAAVRDVLPTAESAGGARGPGAP